MSKPIFEPRFLNCLLRIKTAFSVDRFKAWMLPGPRQKESTIRLGSERRKEI